MEALEVRDLVIKLTAQDGSGAVLPKSRQRDIVYGLGQSYIENRPPNSNNMSQADGLNSANTFPETQVEEMSTSQIVGTTNFTNDSGSRSATIAAPLDISPVMYKNPENMSGTDLAFYLGRPVRMSATVGNNYLTNADTATSFQAFPMPQSALVKPIFADKPRGRLGFRATMVFRLVVNAERFHQGRYMLTWCPMGGANYFTNQKGNKWYNKHCATLMQRSQLPRVEIDLNCDSEVTLRVPYSSVNDFYQFSWANSGIGQGTWGVLRLYPYVPLDYSSGSTQVDFTIYAHFEDVEFVGFASTQIVAQSGSPFATSVKSKSISALEKNKAGVGPIESIAVAVGKAAGLLAPIPLLTNFAGPVQWASDILANVASVFGWNSPLNIEKASRMAITNFAYYGNLNKIDNSLPLSNMTDNEVAILPGFSSTNKDELDLVSFASTPSWFVTAIWGTSYINGYELYGTNVSPFSYFSTSTYNTKSYTNYTPVAYLAKKFALWRGSLIFKFKIVKTEFHSGRIGVVYYPPGDLVRNNVLADYLHRDIIDIREHTEFSITVPYSSSQTYLSTFRNNQHNGFLSLYVVDRLVAPANVSSSISIIMEVCGGPDLEFAAPIKITTHSSSGDFVVQSNDPFKVNSSCLILEKPIGACANPVYQVDTSQMCIGERITSFRQLLKRYCGMQHGVLGTNPFLRIVPFGISALNTTLGVDSLVIWGDLYSELGSMFMYSRGGVRYKIIPNVTTVDTFIGYICAGTDPTNITGLFDTSPTGGAGGDSGIEFMTATSSYALTDLPTSKAVEVQVPQYHFNKSRNNAMECTSLGNPYESAYGTDFTLELSSNKFPSLKPALNDVQIFRAGADDVNFGLFISIPPLYVQTAT